MYKFNLEPLLKHRQYQEELLQKELADLITHLESEENKLQSLIQDRQRCARALKQRQRDGVLVSEIHIYISYIERLSKDLKAQKKRVKSAQKDVDWKRSELVAAMKNRKVLERLKEKGWLDFCAQMRKNDRKFMDEVAATRFLRER
jgi:flagellar FliJ protein